MKVPTRCKQASGGRWKRVGWWRRSCGGRDLQGLLPTIQSAYLEPMTSSRWPTTIRRGGGGELFFDNLPPAGWASCWRWVGDNGEVGG
jgi:hypothetical protein